ncbi:MULTISPECIES: folylpolyglutamate synthase/dihydrofolate synthase family protein [unclassified Gemella]|uniref:bifunctional folylpolyglutamate synthase/dihydrofolate synthase n=1 Tax=unclassified Gemella TaxID=2624949 RepID=UPI001C051D0C|nr:MULTISPECIES: folylpolyglutamate synthase/dihydrofolate synthase family protein [unclassified Gemella]MBU0278963.1 bifunctional folylpolyglutamate synthase/dihydrofolate synthase [Gemella sp. zg-1178]QWQ39071.1 bifunctional folylpolyglutamate synthase/dihydrofolate synthase [Gemella sp. zg-570]
MTINFYKEKLLTYAKKNNINVDDKTLAVFNLENLEDVWQELKKINNDLTIYILEYIAEELIVNVVSKSERSGMKLGLHRMKNILNILGNPEKKLRVIHIAGTNGKGSVSSYLQNTLAQKYKVGMYSSPSMVSFNDRIRINNNFISYQEMYTLYQEISNIWYKNFASDKDNISVFELLTVVAICYFEKNKVDFAIMEVGLGGRFDATNIFENKELSIITKISLDHTNILGDSLEKIAYEKAGIIQGNDNILLYPNKEGVISIIKKVAIVKNARLKILAENYIDVEEIAFKHNIFSYKSFKNIKIKMLGEHQIYNASLALEALLFLREKNTINLTDVEIKKGLENTRWLGRLEWVKNNILLDGAHNIDGVRSLVNYLKKQNLGKIKILIGILADKDYSEMIKLFESLDASFYVTKVPIEIKESKLENLLASFTKEIKIFDNYKQALEDIVPKLKTDETFLVSGSLYLISEVRKELLKEKNDD